MNNDIKLSIIIASWNTLEQTEECINSIIDLPEYSNSTEIIIIDNASADGTSEIIRSKYPQIKLICNNTNAGYAPACNQGLCESKGKYILLLGSDTVLLPGSLSKPLKYLEANPDVTGLGIKLKYPNGDLQSSCKKFPTLLNAFLIYSSLNKFNHKYDMRDFDYEKTIQIDQAATTYFMVRGDIMRKVGGFDEEYRILYNDVDLCQRIYKEGGKIYFYHEAEIYHHGSLSTSKADYRIRKIMYEDIYRYYIRNFGTRAIFLAYLLKLRLLMTRILK